MNARATPPQNLIERLGAEALWDRLSWKDDQWVMRPLSELEDTIHGLVVLSEGSELLAVTRLVDLVEEQIYFAGEVEVPLRPESGHVARAAKFGMEQPDGTPGDALREAVRSSSNLAEVIAGLAEFLLSWNGAYDVVHPETQTTINDFLAPI